MCPIYKFWLFFADILARVLPLQAILGSEGCVCALLEHGASALYRDSQGRTPLHLAASLGHTELLQTLLKAAMKSDPLDSILDYRGYTPTHWAAYYGEISGHKMNVRCSSRNSLYNKKMLNQGRIEQT